MGKSLHSWWGDIRGISAKIYSSRSRKEGRYCKLLCFILKLTNCNLLHTENVVRRVIRSTITSVFRARIKTHIYAVIYIYTRYTHIYAVMYTYSECEYVMFRKPTQNVFWEPIHYPESVSVIWVAHSRTFAIRVCIV